MIQYLKAKEGHEYWKDDLIGILACIEDSKVTWYNQAGKKWDDYLIEFYKNSPTIFIQFWTESMDMVEISEEEGKKILQSIEEKKGKFVSLKEMDMKN